MSNTITQPTTAVTSPELEQIREIIAGLTPEAQALIEKHANKLRDSVAAAPSVFPLALALVGAEVSANYTDAVV